MSKLLVHNPVISALLSLALIGIPKSSTAQASAASTATHSQRSTRRTARKSRSSSSSQFTQLQMTVSQQQQQIDELKSALAQRDQVLQSVQEQLSAIQSTATAARDAATAAQQNAANVQAEQRPVNDELRSGLQSVQSRTETISTSVSESTKKVSELEHPVAIHYKGITLTPGGYFAGEAVYRSRNENADILSTFAGTPYSGSANGHLSEFRGTGRSTRFSLLAEGKVGSAKLSGYAEMDFLGAAPTANENQTSSFNPRARQLFGEASFDSGWTFTAGQTWSLATLNRKGIQTRGEFVPTTIDLQYVPGYTFARLWTARVTKKFGDSVTAALSAENPQTLYSSLTTPATLEGFSSTPLTATAGPGMAVAPSVNVAPDLIGKLAFDTRAGHYEVKAIGRFFRDRVAGVSTNTTYGFGVGVAGIIPIVMKKADLILQATGGQGIGRYGDSSQVDVTIRPDGTIVPIRNLQTMAGLELHPSPKLDWYVYGGDDYLGRAAYVSATGTGYGYGSPKAENLGCNLEVPGTSRCQASTRSVWQATTGFWYRFYKGPYGTLQYGTQYSYTNKYTWQGIGGSPKSNQNIVMTSFRFVLP